jgi:hypothetical protein
LRPHAGLKCDQIAPAISVNDPPLPSSIQQFSTVEAHCLEAFPVLRIGELAASARMRRGCFPFCSQTPNLRMRENIRSEARRNRTENPRSTPAPKGLPSEIHDHPNPIFTISIFSIAVAFLQPRRDAESVMLRRDTLCLGGAVSVGASGAIPCYIILGGMSWMLAAERPMHEPAAHSAEAHFRSRTVSRSCGALQLARSSVTNFALMMPRKRCFKDGENRISKIITICTYNELSRLRHLLDCLRTVFWAAASVSSPWARVR